MPARHSGACARRAFSERASTSSCGDGFPWVQWGFRSHAEVAAEVYPQAVRTMEMMGKVPYADIELQLEVRGLTIPEFKEGAVHAYRHVAEQVSSRPAEFGEGPAAAVGGGAAGEDAETSAADTFSELGECVDEHLLGALRQQRDQYVRDNWRVIVSPSYVRATPLHAFIAPAQELAMGGATSASPRWAVVTGRMLGMAR
eukprot:SAG22_NODE_1577_length_4074_cov_1.659371_1_plen_200_part_00